MKKQTRKPITILMAEDDLDDRLLTEEAFHESRLGNELFFVQDGQDFLDDLHQQGRINS